MNSKKLSIFSMLMVVVMCAFSIFIGISNRGKNGVDGVDGKSAYEMAVESGSFSGTETEYLMSLYGKDGSSVTLEDLYNAYLKEQNLTSSSYTYTDFILDYFSDKIASDDETVTLTQNATQIALRSTVDICYSYLVDDPIIYVQSSGDRYYINSNYNEKYAAAGVAAGSGVIYQMDEDTAYIITNYHVLYISNYTNDSTYRVYYDSTNDEFFNGTYDSSNIKTEVVNNGFFGSSVYSYIEASSVTKASIETHFLNTYSIYVYGYQSSEYQISAQFVGGSSDNDIAVLRVDKNDSENNEILFNGNYKAADIGNSNTLSVGEGVVAVGNPLLADTSTISRDEYDDVASYLESIEQSYIDALCLTSTDGVVSNVSEYCNFSSIIESSETMKLRLIRVSSAINAGNSGGSLFDLSGRLIGIVNGKIESSSYDNVGYAIPVNIATNLADQIISQCDSSTQTRVKVLKSDALGFSVKNSTSEATYDADKLVWTTKNTVVATNITALGKATTSDGIAEGDIIASVEIGGMSYDIKNDYELSDVLLKVIYGDESLYKLTINIVTSSNNEVTTKSITVNLSDSDFVEIK
jgi:S1-C subfamily serine protease